MWIRAFGGLVRFLLRFLSLVSLAAATIAGAMDSIQSVAASRVVIASFGESWKSLSPATYEKWRPLLAETGQSHFYDSIVQWVLAQPAFAVLLVLSLLLWVIGYRRPPVSQGLTA